MSIIALVEVSLPLDDTPQQGRVGGGSQMVFSGGGTSKYYAGLVLIETDPSEHADHIPNGSFVEDAQKYLAQYACDFCSGKTSMVLYTGVTLEADSENDAVKLTPAGYLQYMENTTREGTAAVLHSPVVLGRQVGHRSVTKVRNILMVDKNKCRAVFGDF